MPARVTLTPDEKRDFLLSSEGSFLLLPTKQTRNERHQEREIENPSKWHGFYTRERKFLEGWHADINGIPLSPENQTGFESDLVTAAKTYNITNVSVREEVFAARDALLVNYSTPVFITPEFDFRDRFASTETKYTIDMRDNIAFIGADGHFAVFNIGEKLKQIDRHLYKWYPQDFAREDFCERWVFAPFTLSGNSLALGFGSSRGEALWNLDNITKNFEKLKNERKKVVDSLDAYTLAGAPEDLQRAFSLAVFQLLTIQHDDVLPASGDRWFAGDEGWTRDTAISLEAFFELGLFNTARKLLNFIFDQKRQREDGRLPNNGRMYNSSDGTLWALRRLAEYVNLTGDEKFLEEKNEIVFRAFEGLKKYYLNNGLVRSAGGESWMDTRFTAREGYPVEIQALFIKNCQLYSALLKNDELASLANESLRAFEKFKIARVINRKKRKVLADCISLDGSIAREFRPNALIALECGVVDSETENDVLDLAKLKLADIGIRSLAPNEKGYFAENAGDESYHDGAQWPWLNFLAVKREAARGNSDIAHAIYLKPLMENVLANSGGLNEVFEGSGDETLCPRFQTWSIASFIISACHCFKPGWRNPAKAQQ